MSATIEEISDSAPEQQQQQVPDLNALLAGAGGNVDDDDDEDADVSITDKVTSRAERKSRKSLQGIGLKKIAGVNRVTMRRPRGHLYVIAEPEVYKSSTTDCYIIFGESKAEDMSAQHQAQQQQAQQQQQAAAMQAQLAKLGAGAEAGKGKEEEEDEDDGEEIDETGVDPKDIELVQQQVGCSRRKAVKVLKESDGDLINAIMAAS